MMLYFSIHTATWTHSYKSTPAVLEYESSNDEFVPRRDDGVPNEPWNRDEELHGVGVHMSYNLQVASTWPISTSYASIHLQRRGSFWILHSVKIKYWQDDNTTNHFNSEFETSGTIWLETLNLNAFVADIDASGKKLEQEQHHDDVRHYLNMMIIMWSNTLRRFFWTLGQEWALASASS